WDLIARCNLLGIHSKHDTLVAEVPRPLRDDRGVEHGGTVDAYLLGPGVQHPVHVIERTDTAPYREGDEDVLGNAAHHLDHDVPAVRRCGDIIEYQLIHALLIVFLCHLHRVADVDVVHEFYALGSLAVPHVKADNDPFAEHACLIRQTSGFFQQNVCVTSCRVERFEKRSRGDGKTTPRLHRAW